MRAACLGRCAPGGARKDPDPLGAGGTYAALRRLIGRTAVVGRRGCRRCHAVAFWLVLSRRSGESWAHPGQASLTRRSGGMSIASPYYSFRQDPVSTLDRNLLVGLARLVFADRRGEHA